MLLVDRLFVKGFIVGAALALLVGCSSSSVEAPAPAPQPQHQTRIEAFCDGMSTFAQAGAEWREAGKTEGDLIRAVVADLQQQGAPMAVIKAAVITAVEAYRGELAPSGAKAEAYLGCLKALREA